MTYHETIGTFDFPGHVTNAFANLLVDKELSDVTLVSDDLVPVKAHKIVLSTASPFFKQLLRASPQVQSVLYVSGFDHQMLTNLLHYIYLGKIDPKMENIDAFLKMLKELEIFTKLFHPFDVVKKHEIEENVEFEFREEINVDDVIDDKELPENVTPINYKEKKPPGKKQLLKLKQLTCDQCGHIAKTSERLSIHKQKHTKKYSCRFCSFEAEIQKEMKNHIDEEHPTRKYEQTKKLVKLICDECEFVAKRPIRLTNHIRKFHMPKYPCEECGKTFLTIEKLLIHKEKRHDVKSFFCEECPFQTKYKSALTKHHREKHTDHIYMCDQCEYVTKKQTRIKVHKQTKHEGKRFFCNECDYSAPYREGLQRHYGIKHGGKTYPCEFCEYKATTNGNLKIHIDAKHNGKRYPCDKCDHQATQLGSLKIHKKQHENVL